MALPLQSHQPIPPKSNGSKPLAGVTSVPLDQLLPPISQPRRYFDGTAMQELTASIRENGILQPLLVRSVGDKYEIVAGGRRYRAAVELGLTTIPVTVREMTDVEALQYALVESVTQSLRFLIDITSSTLLTKHFWVSDNSVNSFGNLEYNGCTS